MKAQREFLSYLQWKRKEKMKLRFPQINTNFDAWLKSFCFQKPTPEAYELAKLAWESCRSAKAELNKKLVEISREALVEGRSGGWSKGSPLDKKVETLLNELKKR